MTPEMTKIKLGRDAVQKYRDAHALMASEKVDFSKKRLAIQKQFYKDIEDIGFKDQTEFISKNKEYMNNANIEQTRELTILWQ